MNVIADQKSIAVLRTRLPYVDRRSLSKAWLAALGVADPAATPRAARAAAMVPASLGAAGSRALALPARRQPFVAVAAPVARRAVPSDRRLPVPADAAATPPPATRARRVAANASASAARVAAARSYPTYQTSFAVGLDGARVQLVLRRERNVLHVVALCAPGDVATVGRALARADAHLRASGDRVEATVRATGRADA